MESGDPIVDEEAERQEAVDSLIGSLVKTGEALMAHEATNSGDPLVDEEEEERKARDKLIDELAGKDSDLLAQDSISIEDANHNPNDYMAVDTAEVERHLKKKTLLVEDVNYPGRYLEVDASTKGKHGRHLESDAAPSRKFNKGKRSLGASNTKHKYLADDAQVHHDGHVRNRYLGADATHQLNGPGTTDLTQMFGGAFLLVVVIALFAVANRRRKQPKVSEVVTECDYQLYM